MVQDKNLYRISAMELIEPRGTDGVQRAFHSTRYEHVQAYGEDEAWHLFLRRYHLLPRRQDTDFRGKFRIEQIERKASRPSKEPEDKYVQGELNL